MSSAIKKIPVLGVGVGYRRELSNDINKYKDKIDFLEIISEQFFYSYKAKETLEHLKNNFTIIPHGVDLSIGNAVIDREYIKKIKELCDSINPPYYSEHLCITKTVGLSAGHLTPLWYSKQNLEAVINNVNYLQDYLGLPLLLENITYPFAIPNADYSEVDFFGALVEKTGCGLLLDLTNIVVNSHNHNFDPFEYINNMPMDNVVQIHLAGESKSASGILLDSHDQEVSEATWGLLAYTVKRTQIKSILLERDDNYPEVFETLLEQLDKARSIADLNFNREIFAHD